MEKSFPTMNSMFGLWYMCSSTFRFTGPDFLHSLMPISKSPNPGIYLTSWKVINTPWKQFIAICAWRRKNPKETQLEASSCALKRKCQQHEYIFQQGNFLIRKPALTTKKCWHAGKGNMLKISYESRIGVYLNTRDIFSSPNTFLGNCQMNHVCQHSWVGRLKDHFYSRVFVCFRFSIQKHRLRGISPTGEPWREASGTSFCTHALLEFFLL